MNILHINLELTKLKEADFPKITVYDSQGAKVVETYFPSKMQKQLDALVEQGKLDPAIAFEIDRQLFIAYSQDFDQEDLVDDAYDLLSGQDEFGSDDLTDEEFMKEPMKEHEESESLDSQDSISMLKDKNKQVADSATDYDYGAIFIDVDDFMDMYDWSDITDGLKEIEHPMFNKIKKEPSSFPSGPQQPNPHLDGMRMYVICKYLWKDKNVPEYAVTGPFFFYGFTSFDDAKNILSKLLSSSVIDNDMYSSALSFVQETIKFML